MNFRRYYVPDSIVFITSVVERRDPVFANELYLGLLRETLRKTKELHPFDMIAYVFLPDHMHLLIKPTGTSNFSRIMQSAKSNFTHSYKQAIGIDGNMKFWQKRFYDHVVRDADDFENHVNYIHCNPIKHGYVTRPEDWPHSSFSVWKQRGAYPERWGWKMYEAAYSFNVDDVE
jgi:putative transposase